MKYKEFNPEEDHYLLARICISAMLNVRIVCD